MIKYVLCVLTYINGHRKGDVMKGKETKGIYDDIPTIEDIAKDIPTIDELLKDAPEMFDISGVDLDVNLDDFTIDLDSIPVIDLSELDGLEIPDFDLTIPDFDFTVGDE